MIEFELIRELYDKYFRVDVPKRHSSIAKQMIRGREERRKQKYLESIRNFEWEFKKYL